MEGACGVTSVEKGPKGVTPMEKGPEGMTSELLMNLWAQC